MVAKLHALMRPKLQTTIATGPSGAVSSRVAQFSFFSPSRFATYRCRLVAQGQVVPVAFVPGWVRGVQRSRGRQLPVRGGGDLRERTGRSHARIADVLGVLDRPRGLPRRPPALRRRPPTSASFTYTSRCPAPGTNAAWSPLDAASPVGVRAISSGASFADLGRRRLPLRRPGARRRRRGQRPRRRMVLPGGHHRSHGGVLQLAGDQHAQRVGVVPVRTGRADQGFDVVHDRRQGDRLRQRSREVAARLDRRSHAGGQGDGRRRQRRDDLVRLDGRPHPPAGRDPGRSQRSCRRTRSRRSTCGPTKARASSDAAWTAPRPCRASARRTSPNLKEGRHTLEGLVGGPRLQRVARHHLRLEDRPHPAHRLAWSAVRPKGRPPVPARSRSASRRARRASSGARSTGSSSRKCSSPVRFADLPSGDHTFQVYAVDAAGNQSVTAERTWTIT